MAETLQEEGHVVSERSVNRLLQALGKTYGRTSRRWKGSDQADSCDDWYYTAALVS